MPVRFLRLILVTLLSGLGAAANAGCSSGPPPATTDSAALVLRGAGSTFSSLLFAQWATTYHQLHPDVAVRYDSVGSGEGVRRFFGQTVPAEQAVDFGASDSAMSDAQLAQAPDTLMLPVTGGCRRSAPAKSDDVRRGRPTEALTGQDGPSRGFRFDRKA